MAKKLCRKGGKEGQSGEAKGWVRTFHSVQPSKGLEPHEWSGARVLRRGSRISRDTHSDNKPTGKSVTGGIDSWNTCGNY